MLSSDELDYSSKKGKVSITPPTSPSSTSSFSFQQNGFYNNNVASSPRLMSDSSDGGIEGQFKFLDSYNTPDCIEVFAISDGNVNHDTLPDKSHGSKPGSTAGTLPGSRESNFSEDKYRWNDTETSTKEKPKQTNKRMICLIVFITILVLALIGVAVAVILVYTVFDVGDKDEIETTTLRPEILYLEGSLDLKETWTDELINPNSSLYISTANNFTLEMDNMMKNSSYSESYIRTEVISFSPGSIQVRFKMIHDYRYKRKGRTAPEFAGMVKEHLIQKAPGSHLPIDTDTIYLQVFPIVFPTTTATTTDAKPVTLSASGTEYFSSPDALSARIIKTAVVTSGESLKTSSSPRPDIVTSSSSRANIAASRSWRTDIVKSSPPRPDIVKSSSPRPDIVTSSSPKPNQVTSSSTRPNIVLSSFSRPNIVSSSSPRPVIVTSSSPRLSIVSSSSLGTDIVSSSSSRTDILLSPSSRPYIVSSSSLKPGIVTSSSPGPDIVSSSSPRPNIVSSSSSRPNIVSSSSPTPNIVSSSSLRPNIVSSSSPEPDIVSSSSPRPNVVSSSSPKPNIVSSSSPRPNVVSSSSPKPDIVSSSSPRPNIVSSSSPRPNIVSSSSPKPDIVSSSAPRPIVVSSSSPRPSIVSSSSPRPNIVSSSSPRPNIVSSSSPKPDRVSSSAPRPIVVSSSSPRPSIVSSSPPKPDIVSSSSPKPDIVSSSSPRPIVVSSSSSRPNIESSSSPKPDIVSSSSPKPDIVSSSSLRPNVVSSSSPRPNIVSSSSLRPNVVSASSPRPNTVSFSSPRIDIVSSSSSRPNIVSSSSQRPNIVSSLSSRPKIVSSFSVVSLTSGSFFLKGKSYKLSSSSPRPYIASSLSLRTEIMTPSSSRPSKMTYSSPRPNIATSSSPRPDIALTSSPRPDIVTSSCLRPYVVSSSSSRPYIVSSSSPRPNMVSSSSVVSLTSDITSTASSSTTSAQSSTSTSTPSLSSTTSSTTTTATASTSTTISTTTSTTTPTTTSTPSPTTTSTTSPTTSTTTTSTTTSATTPTTTPTTSPTTTSTTTSTSSSTTTSTTPSTTTTPTTTTEPDRSPVADAGSDITITLPQDSVVLDGSASADDHGITAYQWQKISPQSVDVVMRGADTKKLSVSDLIEGTYTFRLTVSDRSGQTDQDTISVVVKPAPTTTTLSTSTTPKQVLCLPVNFTMCSSRGFTQTVFPNLYQQSTEVDAEEAFNNTIENVLNQICQEATIYYLCSLYFPKCDAVTGLFIVPCQSLCNAAISNCGNHFKNLFPCIDFPESECVPLPTTATTEKPTCEPTLPQACKDLGFTKTKFPNFINEPDQDGANLTYNYYTKPIAESGCHVDALFLVCAVQFPMCASGKTVTPCRKTCEAVTTACTDLSFIPCSEFEEFDCVNPPPQTEPPSIKRKCKQSEFTCGRVEKCILEDKVCNGIDDCGDWTDEMDCDCGEYEYQCDMGMCIKSYQRCDGEAQCPDKSDEDKCDGCTHGAVKCPSGECIMSEWMCDGRAECKDGWDEYNCDVCGFNQFTCADRDRTCIDLRKRCDGVPDCPDGYDEWDCINQEKGILEIPHMKFFLPICADSWSDDLGHHTCSNLLGEGAYINKTDIAYNVHVFARLTPDGTQKSVLGPWEMSYDCPSSKGFRVNCEPRGCGKKMVELLTEVIVNGEDALPGEYPWHVALYFGGQYFCGGSLISDSFVLTAAHCVEQFRRDFKLMTVKLGANNRQTSETTQHVIKVEAIESHTDHVYFKRNDIALLQLESPVTFTKYIQPICLPKPEDPLPLYSTCFTVGWGKTKWDGDYADVLQKLKMTLWDTKKCNSSIAWNGEVYDTFLCAGYYSGVRSICKKDSGGPLLCLDKDKTWKLRGINSYVGNYCNMTERPNVFSNVSMFRSWIDDKIECKFRCDNGKCLYYSDQLCNRIDNCGDNSDEERVCNKTLACDFEDKFLCGYEFVGWKLGYDNKNAEVIKVDGQIYTKSNAPQFDHTKGKYPGKFFFGKEKEVREAHLWSPRFSTNGQTCIRFAYYQRGSIKLGLSVYLYEYRRGGNENDPSESRRWTSGTSSNSLDEWKTGYFDISLGEFRLNFTTGDLLSAAIDDIIMIPGMCSDVLCRSDEFRCRHQRDHKHKCIAEQLHCNLAIDCDEQDDESTCTQGPSSYICTFENGNLCALYQEVGDASDWWLVNATFVRAELRSKTFVDHTLGTEDGFMFYINANNLQTSSNHIYMWQLFYLRSQQYCFSFYYKLKANVNLNVHVDCQGCTRKTYLAQSTFDDNWTLFQINLPIADVVNITYDVEGQEKSENFIRAFVVLDDIFVKPGSCPEFVCKANYTKCNSFDRCIPISALCDRKVDCLDDESDEIQCDCTSNEFRCTSGRCIPQVYKCDRKPQCQDSSDEGDVCKSLLSVSCTFEHPYMCGYEFIQYTIFRWQRNQGSTDTYFTGPAVDHTYLNETGHYMYTEANDANKGDNTSMISPTFYTGYGQSVQFYYHMLSILLDFARPGILQFSLENTQMQTNTVKWQASQDDLSEKWRKVCIDLPDNSNLRLWFTAIRNNKTIYGVDMAIDDVKLDSHKCQNATSPPQMTTSTTSRPTTPGCGQDKWKCNDATCIPASFRCDNESDCPDSSDEQGCS